MDITNYGYNELLISHITDIRVYTVNWSVGVLWISLEQHSIYQTTDKKEAYMFYKA